jgi:hypothetical protein
MIFSSVEVKLLQNLCGKGGKKIMKTRNGSYEFLVMPFGLCNGPFSFTTLMNSIFHEKLNDFIIICINNILVYFKSIKEHVKHLKFVLQKIQNEQALC